MPYHLLVYNRDMTIAQREGEIERLQYIQMGLARHGVYFTNLLFEIINSPALHAPHPLYIPMAYALFHKIRDINTYLDSCDLKIKRHQGVINLMKQYPG